MSLKKNSLKEQALSLKNQYSDYSEGVSNKIQPLKSIPDDRPADRIIFKSKPFY